MMTNGTLWAWSLDTHFDETRDKNSLIRDSYCDCVFVVVYGLDQEYHVPDCVKSTGSD